MRGVETEPCLDTGGIDAARIGVQKGPKRKSRKAGIEIDPGLLSLACPVRRAGLTCP